ncbi:MAG: protein-methionine-sulfoxide reductase heme-binding subunit MsrQ [Longimicrobiales bacterium]|nr:protein-methionine-sulfoxide reductase heme-binding subunit MsrQ [Longimicrobiales bacterium]
MTLRRHLLLLRLLAWTGAGAPLLWMAYRILLGEGLGADPTQELTHWSGGTALVLLLTTLAVTPIRRLTGWNTVQKVRRLLGVWAFVYATIHMAVYVVLDQALAIDFILEDVLERRFTLVGAAAFVLLIPLAITSTRGWIRRLGRTWTRLHRLVYAAALLAVVHFELGQKADFTLRPVVAGVVLASLLGARVWFSLRARPAGGGATGGSGTTFRR